MEAFVWVGTRGRFNPFQRFERGVLSLEGDMLTFRGRGGDTVATRLSEANLRFPLSMMGGGFVMTMRNAKSYVWFSDPYATRNALLRSGDSFDAGLGGAKSELKGRRAARAWLKALKAHRPSGH